MTSGQVIPPETASLATREHALDAARGLLMVLGILLHAGNIYSVDSSWIVSDPQSSGFFNAMVSLIHVFRMPTFFWISGYFCAMIYLRTNAQLMLKSRLPRLAIPLMTSWVVLNGGQNWLISFTNPQFSVEKATFGIPLYHLWFLVDLIVMTAIGSVVAPWLRVASASLEKSCSMTRLRMLLFVVFVTYLINAFTRATGFAYDAPLNLTSLYRLATYTPFFIVGMYMRMEPRSRQREC